MKDGAFSLHVIVNAHVPGHKLPLDEAYEKKISPADVEMKPSVPE